MIGAVFFDWGNGIIARQMKDRTDEYKFFGGQLDSLIDIVNFGICALPFFFWLCLHGLGSDHIVEYKAQ